jgi:hypothetical protein
VLLAANAAVAQQLRDVEEAARHAVDGVFAVAGAEQRAGDLHLVELDGEHAGVVVDRERHLGASERGLTGGTGEDDVVHLAGPDRRGSLSAEDPCDRVDDVGFARTIGADDDSNAGLEIDRGRVGKGLEALQREVLQMHQG